MGDSYGKKVQKSINKAFKVEPKEDAPRKTYHNVQRDETTEEVERQKDEGEQRYNLLLERDEERLEKLRNGAPEPKKPVSRKKETYSATE